MGSYQYSVGATFDGSRTAPPRFYGPNAVGAVAAVFVVSNGLTRWSELSTRKIEKDPDWLLAPATYSVAASPFPATQRA